MNAHQHLAQIQRAAQLAAAQAPAPEPSFGAILRDLLPEFNDKRPDSAREAYRERLASVVLAQERGLQPQGILIGLPPLKRDMSAAGVSGSNYLVGTDTAPGGIFVNALRDASLLGALPIQEVGPLVGDAVFPRITAGSNAVWLATEGDTLMPQDLTFGNFTVTPKTIGAIVSTSYQFRKQITPVAERYLLTELAAGIGAGLDAALVNGSGVSGEPAGLLTAADVGTQSGTSLAWSGVLAMMEAVEASKAVISRTSLAWLASPDVAELLRGRQRFTGSSSAICEGDTIAGRPMVVHGAVPPGTLVFGDWSRLWLAHWGALDFAVTESHDTDFRIGTQRLRAMFCCDVVVSAPTAFCVAGSVT